MSMNDADLRFRASLSDDVTPQVDKITQALKKAGASNAEIKMTLRAIDEATPKIKEAQKQIRQMPQQTVINVNANVTQAQETMKRFRHEAETPVKVSFIEDATNNISRLAGKLRGVANTATLPLANALPMGLGYNLYYGLGAGILGGAGLGASALAKSTIGANSDREQSLVTLQQTMKDNTRATQELGKLVGIAQKTPFNYSDLLQADVRLRSYQIPALPQDVASAHGKDPTQGKGWLKLAGDMSAAFNYPITQSVEAIADARQGYFRRLEDFGIRLQSEDFAKGGKYSGLTFEQGLTRAIKPFAGSQDIQSKTLKGIESNLHDVFQNQVLVPIGAIPTAALKQGAQQLYTKSNTPDFQRQLGTDIQGISRGLTTGLMDVQKGKDMFNENIKQPLMDATKAVINFGQVVVKNFGGTVLTVVKTFASTVGLLSSTIRQIAGSGVTDFLVKWITVMKALQFMGFRSADPILGLAKSINPLNFSLRGVLGNLLAIPGAIAKIGTLILIKNFIEAKQAAEALHNQFKDLSDNKFDKLNADILLMAHGLDQSGESMQRLVTMAAGGIPGGVKDRPEIATEIAKQAAGAGRDGLDPKLVVQGVLDEMKRTHEYSTDAAKRFAQDVDVAGVSVKDFGISLSDLQRTIREFASVAGPVGLGGYKGAPALAALQVGANAVPVTSQQINSGISSGDTLLMRMLQGYHAPSIDMLSALGRGQIDKTYSFHPSGIASEASNFFDRNDTYNQNDRSSRRLLGVLHNIAPDARVPNVPNPWNENHMGINFGSIRDATDPAQRANLVFKDWEHNNKLLDSVQGNVTKLTDALNRQNAVNIAYQQGLDNIGLQLQEFQHTLVPLQRQIEDQTLVIQKYQLEAIHPLERQLTRLNQVAAEVGQTLQNSQYDMAKYSEGLLTGEQAALDQLHALEQYNKQLQLLQLLNQQLGSQLGSTTYERGYSATVKPIMGITLEMQMQKNERDQQRKQLQYDLGFGEQHYQLEQAARPANQRRELGFSERLAGIKRNVPIIDDAVRAQHRLSNSQFELQSRVFHLNEHLQDQEDALQGLQIKLQEASQSPHFRHLQDEQYKLQVASTQASLSLQTQQQTIDRWNATVTDLKSQGLDLGNIFHSMMGFDTANPIENARKMIGMMEKLPQSLGGISKDQGDSFMKQLDKMQAATDKAMKHHIDTSQSWFDQLKKGFLGLFNEDTWNIIGAQVKHGLDPIIGSSLAGFLGGGVSIAGEVTTIAISSGIIGNMIRLMVGRAFNNILSRSGMFTGFYEGVSNISQRFMRGATDAGLPGGRFFATRAVAAQQMADGTRLGGTVSEAVLSPFRVIRRFRELLYGGGGAAIGGAAFGPVGALIGGAGGRSVAQENTLRDAGRAIHDTYVAAAKTATTVEEKMKIAADATKKVADEVSRVVKPAAQAAADVVLKVPGAQTVADVVSQTRGARAIGGALRAPMLPMDLLKKVADGKLTPEEAAAIHAASSTTPVAPATTAAAAASTAREATLLNTLRGKFGTLGDSVDAATATIDKLAPAAESAATNLGDAAAAAAPAAASAAKTSPTAVAAVRGGGITLEDMLKFRKISGPLGVIFDTALASGKFGQDAKNQGTGGLIGTGVGALALGLARRSVGGALFGAGLGGLIGSAAEAKHPGEAAAETIAAIVAQKYLIELARKLIPGIKNLFGTKIAPVMAEEGTAAGIASATANAEAATGPALTLPLLTRGKAAFTRFFGWEKAASAAAGAESGAANATGVAEGAAVAGTEGAAVTGAEGAVVGGAARAGTAAGAGSFLSRLKGGAGAGLAIGIGGNLVGSLIGGGTGSTVSHLATGAGIGATVGSIIPGLGTLAGGAIGGAVAGLVEIFNSDKSASDKFRESAGQTFKTLSQARDAGALDQLAKQAANFGNNTTKAGQQFNDFALAVRKRAQQIRDQDIYHEIGAQVILLHKITGNNIKGILNSLDKMSPAAAAQGRKAIIELAQQMEKHHLLASGSADKLRKLMIKHLDGRGVGRAFVTSLTKAMNDGLVQSAADAAGPDLNAFNKFLARFGVKELVPQASLPRSFGSPGIRANLPPLFHPLHPSGTSHIPQLHFPHTPLPPGAGPAPVPAPPGHPHHHRRKHHGLFAPGTGHFRQHAGGLDRVPYDGYLAELHQDEAVVPASVAQKIRSGDVLASDPMMNEDFYRKVQKKRVDHEERMKKVILDYRQKDDDFDKKEKKDRQDQTDQHHKYLEDATTTHGDNINKIRDSALQGQNSVEDKGFGRIYGTTTDWLKKVIKAVKGVDTSLGLSTNAHNKSHTPASASPSSSAGASVANVAAGSLGFAGGGLSKADIHRIGMGRIVRLNEEGHDEMVIPLAPHRRNRAKSLMSQAKSIMGFANGGVSMVDPGKSTFLDGATNNPSVGGNKVLDTMRQHVPLPRGGVHLYVQPNAPFPERPLNVVDPVGSTYPGRHAIWVKNIKGDYRAILGHELGHLYDAYTLNDKVRAQYTKMFEKTGDIFSSKTWISPTDHNSAAEEFADMYAQEGLGYSQGKGFDKKFKRLLTQFANGGTAYVGDSLGVGTEPYLKSLVGGRFFADDVVGRSSASGLSALRGILKGHPNLDRIIFDLGTNDGSASALRSSLSTADRISGHIPIVTMTTHGPAAAAKNRMLRGMAGGDINLVDWAGHSAGLVGPDGIHSTGRGYNVRAHMIASILGHAQSGGGASTVSPLSHTGKSGVQSGSMGMSLQPLNALFGHKGLVGYANGGYVFPLPDFGSEERVDRGQDMEAKHPYANTVALGDGTVTSATIGWPGMRLRLSNGPFAGNEVFYGHNNKVWARVGQHLRAGQKIGQVGNLSGGGDSRHTEIGFMQGYNSQSGSWSGPGSQGGMLMHSLLHQIAPQWIGSTPIGGWPSGWNAARVNRSIKGLSLSAGAGTAAANALGAGSVSLPGVPDELKNLGLVGTRLQQILQARKGIWTSTASRKASKGSSNALSAFTGLGGSAAQNRALGKKMAEAYAGWGHGSEWNSLDQIWTHESGWNANAKNPNSPAYGIPQSDGHGHVYNYGDAAAQIKWGLNYIKHTYGDPNRAWSYWQGHHSYAGGIRNVPYDNMPAVLHKGERVLTASENNYVKSGGPIATGGQVQAHGHGGLFSEVNAEARLLSAIEELHAIRADIRQVRNHLKDINDKTQKQKEEHHLQELNQQLRQQWATVRRDTRVADTAIAHKIKKAGDASDGEATNALVLGETSKYHTIIDRAVQSAKHSKPYKHAVHAATQAKNAVDRAVRAAHGAHSPGGKKVTHAEQTHINQLKHHATQLAKVPKHILDQARKHIRGNYVVGAAHRGVNPDLIRQVTGKGLNKPEQKLYAQLVKELQNGSKNAGKTAAALRKAIQTESSKVIKTTTKHHADTVKYASAAKKQRDSATKETRKITTTSDKADKNRDKAEKAADKREKDFYKSALGHLETIAHKDLNVTVNNTATGATLKSTIAANRRRKK